MGVGLREPGRTKEREISVRRPFLKDFPAILEISNWATCRTAANFKTEPDTLEHLIGLWEGKDQRFPWFVAENGGAVVGFATAWPFSGRCGYAYTAEVSVYVDPDQLSRGVGQALYHQLIPTLKAQGFRTVVAVVAIPNPPSERLHRKFGFRKVGTLARVGWKLGKWHDVAYWQRVFDDRDDAPGPIKTAREVRVGTEDRA